VRKNPTFPQTGITGRFVEVERWGGVLLEVTRDPRFAADRGFRLAEAKGAANAVQAYGAAGDSKALRRWRSALADVARRSPEESEIQEYAGEFGVTYVDQRSRGWPYGPPPST
jgi:hypothetical protein